MAISLRRALIGAPLPTARALHERLSKVVALPVFASDAISSSAYATEAILVAILAGAGTSRLSAVLPIGFGIFLLLWIVSFSYRQTVLAYPTGGGSYIVARESLGIGAATIAGASLLIDYILTVAVSVAAGIAAVTSAFPFLRPHTVLLCAMAVALIALANLRGVRESGLLFSIPTYSFVASMLVTIAWGVLKAFSGYVPPPEPGVAPLAPPLGALASLPLFLALHAYASGCTALTGVEAISNGVQAFRPPEGRNAAVTMLWMAGILGVLFMGVTYLAWAFHVVPSAVAEGSGGETVVSKITRMAWGGKHGFYYVVQFTTMAVLVVAANTSFADFPRLSAILARDRFLPRQFANVGDRLVYNYGILTLAVLAVALIAILSGNVNGLLPLYAVGVFLSFTLSQAGMVRRWFRLRTPGWRHSAAINGFGACVTGIVLLVLAITKFHPSDANVLFRLPFGLRLPLIGDSVRAGAWLVVLLIPLMVGMFYRIHAHYLTAASQLTLVGYRMPPPPPNTIIVLVPSVNRGIIPALQYAKSLGQDTRALHIETEPEATPRLREEWDTWGLGIPLLIMESPYRSLVAPLFRYLDEVQTERRHMVTLVIPEFVAVKWWHKLLHNQSGLILKLALLRRKDVVVTNVRYYLAR